MSTPIFKLIFDRRHRASATKEGAIELRITYNRIQNPAPSPDGAGHAKKSLIRLKSFIGCIFERCLIDAYDSGNA